MNWQQFQSILWLRWRLSRNQWSRGGAVNAVIMLVVTALGLAVAVAGGVAGVGVGAFVLSKAEPRTLLFIWDGIIGAFLFFWVIGIVTELQRSESIDLSRLLHLPVSLRGVFLLNYAASHVTLRLIVFLPAMLGLSAGLVFGVNWRMLLLVPLVLSFVFMVTAWTYCLRGWLIALMVNPRRRRTVIMVATMSMILVSQLPNLYFNVIHRVGGHRSNPAFSSHGNEAQMLASFMAAHRFVPPLWVGQGVMALASGNNVPALCGSAGALLLGALGLRRAWGSTLRFYRGDTGGKAARPTARTPAPQARGMTFLERRLPGVPEEPAALALALFRSMMRAPEVKMALGSNIVVLVLLSVMFFSRGGGVINGAAGPFMATGVVALPFFSLAQLMFNQFGLDRDGFRALVLLPARRRDILFAKNLAFLPLGLGICLLLLIVVEALARLPFPVFLAALFQFATVFFLLSAAGNLASILTPYRVAVGSLKPTKAPAKKMIVIFLSHLLCPIAIAPVFLPAALGLLSANLGWLPAAWVDLFLSILLAGGMAGIYWLSLGSLGSLLQRREKEVLQAVTQEVE